MKKLICLFLVAVMAFSVFACGNKQSEFEPVEGHEELSEIIFGTEFGMTYDEYVKSSAHKIMSPVSVSMQYTTQEEIGNYPDKLYGLFVSESET